MSATSGVELWGDELQGCAVANVFAQGEGVKFDCRLPISDLRAS